MASVFQIFFLQYFYLGILENALQVYGGSIYIWDSPPSRHPPPCVQEMPDRCDVCKHVFICMISSVCHAVCITIKS